jgi:UPF0716 family protein affecting phage T7 exclusion
MTPVVALVWFVCMTVAVFLTIAAGVFLAARSGTEHPHREHAWAHATHMPRLHLPPLRHRRS